jgi:hypothetical protein
MRSEQRAEKNEELAVAVISLTAQAGKASKILLFYIILIYRQVLFFI